MRTTEDGSATLVDGSGRACHSSSGAWTQARERYAAGLGLGRRRDLATCRLLDVGTGTGLNLAAALEALAPAGVPLVVHALECSRGVLERSLALTWPAATPWHGQVQEALAAALDQGAEARAARGVPLGDGGRLHLCLGDGRAELPRLDPGVRFDAVHLDPFAPAEAPELWEAEFLAQVARRMDPGARLVTYSASLEVRARLALAGLVVGRLGKVGAKAEGTAAERPRDPGRPGEPGPAGPLEPLVPRTARKLARRVERMRRDVAS